MARVWGATVYVTAGTEDKCRFCEQLGARAAINYRSEDFVERVRQLTVGKGVDVILDMVGGDYLQRNLDSLAPDGRLVQIAVQQGPKTGINLLPVLLKRLTLTGSTLRPRPVSFKAAIADKLRDKVWPALESGAIRPVVFGTFPLEQAADAHRLMEESGHKGKIVLTLHDRPEGSGPFDAAKTGVSFRAGASLPG
jgi:NADPH:quinone reductase-like Zn-dependent oxidoreductase